MPEKPEIYPQNLHRILCNTLRGSLKRIFNYHKMKALKEVNLLESFDGGL